VARRRAQVVAWERARRNDVEGLAAAWTVCGDGVLPWRALSWVVAFRDARARAHRVDGPALVRADGHREWCVEGLWHRIDGPAVILADGTCRYLQHGRLHRVDGPAVIAAGGGEEWWCDGVRHRTDGPALIPPAGEREWWLQGERVAESDVHRVRSASLAEALFAPLA